MSSNYKTAEELLAELNANPVTRAARERQDAALREFDRMSKVAQRPLLEDLRTAGVDVTDVWDLVNTKAPYAAAIPVLLTHIERDYIPEVRDGIARALAVREASWAWDVIRTLFLREPAGGRRNVKWSLASALGGATTDEHIGQLINLIKDQSLGEYRLAWLLALGRSKKREAKQTLEELRQDPQLSREVRRLFGRPKRKP